MTAATLTLTDFLLARIAEDEEAAKAASEGSPDWDAVTDGDEPWIIARPEFWRIAMVANTFDGHHIARHDPARVLAECGTKRRIVDVARYAPEGSAGWGFRRILRALAAVYSDHPDYREEWRP